MKRSWVVVVSALLVASPWSPAAAGGRDDKELIRNLDREIQALREKLRVYEDAGGDCGAMAPPDEIYSELVTMYAGQPVGVTRKGNHTFVSVPAAILFATDEVRLREEGGMTLDLLASVLNAHKSDRITIVGHTHSEPPPAALRKRYPSNLEYSVARATVVAMEMIGKYGVAQSRLTVAGRGGSDPVAPNDTPGERAQNERVVFEIVPGGL